MGKLTYIRAKQRWHSLLYVIPSVPQTRLDVWEQSGDSAICSQMGYEREDRKEALRDSEAVRGNPGLCLEPECIDPAEPGGSHCWQGLDASLGTSAKGLGLLSMEHGSGTHPGHHGATGVI